MAESLDPYRALGVARGATKAQIKAAHRTSGQALPPGRLDRRRAALPRRPRGISAARRPPPPPRVGRSSRAGPRPRRRATVCAATPPPTRGRQPTPRATHGPLVSLVGQRGAVVGGGRACRESAPARRAQAEGGRRAGGRPTARSPGRRLRGLQPFQRCCLVVGRPPILPPFRCRPAKARPIPSPGHAAADRRPRPSRRRRGGARPIAPGHTTAATAAGHAAAAAAHLFLRGRCRPLHRAGQRGARCHAASQARARPGPACASACLSP